MGRTFVSNHRGHEFSILCKDWPNGWVVEIRFQIPGIPMRRFDNEPFNSYAEARECAELEAKALIDELIDKGAIQAR